ncbi:EAL domain-containing protein [Pseudoluteimonas lycopersici]|uniref:EAL domain-containing protein n=1 Tax=Pseudoluteimonas lycopersici TaxID=1324796 RepID=A0A516V3R0_9GAMM|nr:EAL domain-containing protein [Lysobacter lycopersici]QDQ73171.1 EAL domain-containing protein [Lysobacter lycopersici]
MSKGTDAALRLVVVDDSVEDAEAIVSGLRNAGIAIRPQRPASAEELSTLLSGQAIDLVLASRSAQAIPFDEAMQLVVGSGKDIPVLVLFDDIDAAGVAAALGAGARAIALRDKPQQLLQAVRNEWADLDARRALRRLEAQVRETERRCDALIESSREPIAYVHEGMHIRANSAYLEMFGFDSFDDVEGMSLLDLVAPRHVADFKQLLKQLSKGEAPPPSYELEARGMDGEEFPAVMEFTQASYEGEACVQVVFRRQELANDPELAQKLKDLQERDPVTGLLNRQTFLRTLEDAISDAGKNQARHGLLLVEPDHYQRLLHDMGLDASDAILAAMAGRLKGALQGDAVAARFGEHSLAVLLHGGDHVGTPALAERIRAAFADGIFEVGDHSSAITASIGGVQIGEKIANVSQVLARANQGVQSALGVGGNRFEIFDPSATDRAEEERIQAWVARLRDALDKDQFVLHYRPVISLLGEPEPLYEAYLRLDAGEGEMVGPTTFMQIAEEHGLLAEIDRWVAGHAIAVLGERLKSGKPVTLLMRISQDSLGDERFAKHIAETLLARGVPGDRLVLQLSESKVFTHMRDVQSLIESLRKLGVRTGLEQFGAGIDSMQLLTHVTPAFLKLDRSFMEDLPKNADNQKRIQAIAAHAREHGMRSIAEFVQDAASMSTLFSCGVDYVEGDFLALPSAEMNYEFE